jgi:hypothetical protein
MNSYKQLKINKSQIPNTKKITMTEIQNHKQLAFDHIRYLDIVICYFGLSGFRMVPNLLKSHHVCTGFMP